MTRIAAAILAILALTWGGSATAQASSDIEVSYTLDCQGHAVTVTATGYSLAVDDRFQVVSGRATTVALTTSNAAGVRTVTATFASSEVGENGTAIIRTRYGGYVEAYAYPIAMRTRAELISFRTC